MWTYNFQNRGTDGGSYIGNKARVAGDISAAALALAPLTTDVATWGAAAAWREAPLHRAAEFNAVTYDMATETDAIKNMPASGIPVLT